MKEEELGKKKGIDKNISILWFRISKSYRFLVIISIFITLLIIFSLFIKIPFLLDTPWTTVRIYVFFTPAIIFSMGIMFRPTIVFLIMVFGLTAAEILFCIIYGCSGEFPIFLISKLISQGGSAVIISLLCKKNEILAMIMGGIWMFIGLFITSYLYYVLILHWGRDYIIFYSILFGMINILFIPLSLLINKTLRFIFKVKYLEELIGLKGR